MLTDIPPATVDKLEKMDGINIIEFDTVGEPGLTINTNIKDDRYIKEFVKRLNLHDDLVIKYNEDNDWVKIKQKNTGEDHNNALSYVKWWLSIPYMIEYSLPSYHKKREYGLWGNRPPATKSSF